MKRVQEVIRDRQKVFAAQPFFKRIEGPGSMEQARALVPNLTFFALAFQDMLRLNEERVADPRLLELVRQHRCEDQSHGEWFLDDMTRLGTERDVRWLFGSEHVATRDAAYALVSEVLSAREDLVRVAIILVLESTGEVFFGRIPGYIARTGYEGSLEYFSEKHREVESGHALHGGDVQRRLAHLECPPWVRRSAIAMVDRAFEAMTKMVSGFETSMARSTRGEGLGAADRLVPAREGKERAQAGIAIVQGPERPDRRPGIGDGS